MLKKILRIASAGLGASLLVSAAVNILAARQLIDAAEEQSLGVTRHELYLTYGSMAVVGSVLVWLGVRKWK